MHYIKAKNIKKFYADNDRQVSKEFISAMDSIVHSILTSTLEVWNGRHKRVDSSLLPAKVKTLIK